MKEITKLNGQVFGYLEVIERYHKPCSKGIYYSCLCHKCGNIVYIRKDVLPHETMCIDCSRKSRKGITHPLKGKTMISKIGAITKSNKSGVAGVNWDKSRNKWQVSIRYKGTRYNLGRFDDFDEAVEIRKVAEEKIKLHEQKNSLSLNQER